MTRSTIRALSMGLGLSLLTLATVAAPAEVDEEAAARGRVTYRIYCSNCHGDDARGDGELAKYLTVEPADLTTITQRYDGEFPAAWLRRVIDGREVVRGHGMREMPVWGVGFPDPGKEDEQSEIVQEKIEQLLEFLRTIQVEPEADDPAG